MNAHQFAKERARIEYGRDIPERKRNKALAHLVNEARAVLVVVDRKIVAYRLPNGESVCVKRRYSVEAKALADLARMENIGDQRVPKRAYACAYCLGFHLTSQAAQYLEPA